MDFRRRTASITLVYIFVGSYFAPRVMSTCKNKYPISAKMLFLVVPEVILLFFLVIFVLSKRLNRNLDD